MASNLDHDKIPGAKRQHDLNPREQLRLDEKLDRDAEEDETSSSGTSSSESELDNTQDNSGGSDSADGESPSDSNARSTLMPRPKHESSLQSRLKDFLPRLQEANAELGDAEHNHERKIDHVAEDEEHYIEMNLGLGVLSGQDPTGEECLKFKEPATEDDLQVSVNENAEDEAVPLPEVDAMSRLRGEKPQHGQKRKIQEVG